MSVFSDIYRSTWRDECHILASVDVAALLAGSTNCMSSRPPHPSVLEVALWAAAPPHTDAHGRRPSPRLPPPGRVDGPGYATPSRPVEITGDAGPGSFPEAVRVNTAPDARNDFGGPGPSFTGHPCRRASRERIGSVAVL
ncbi:hypothetical protein GCM10010124_18790 [Pilimelia terevasa]|uniref:Uncharacterized protein n=1 Tax=Pilimelia terevasa TaxID=53372 RepID=A0A8J3BJP1_9ACTN|nr:hypothetical protein GCM10010124_18790 [Pilimelia terevasa]